MTMTARGAPPSSLLPIAIRAHEIQPHAGSAMTVAEVLLRMCEGAPPERALEWSRRSLTWQERMMTIRSRTGSRLTFQ